VKLAKPNLTNSLASCRIYWSWSSKEKKTRRRKNASNCEFNGVKKTTNKYVEDMAGQRKDGKEYFRVVKYCFNPRK